MAAGIPSLCQDLGTPSLLGAWGKFAFSGGGVDTTGWTFDATGADALNLRGKFKFANGKLTLRMSGGGMTLLVK